MKLKNAFVALAAVLIVFPVFGMSEQSGGTDGFNVLLGLLELPFLVIALIFSFVTANSLQGGKFGSGMKYLAWGFLVMAIGHLHMQFDYHFGFNLFNSLLGELGGKVAWFIALVFTWALSGYGFYQIWKASGA